MYYDSQEFCKYIFEDVGHYYRMLDFIQFSTSTLFLLMASLRTLLWAIISILRLCLDRHIFEAIHLLYFLAFGSPLEAPLQ